MLLNSKGDENDTFYFLCLSFIYTDEYTKKVIKINQFTYFNMKSSYQRDN